MRSMFEISKSSSTTRIRPVLIMHLRQVMGYRKRTDMARWAHNYSIETRYALTNTIQGNHQLRQKRTNSHHARRGEVHQLLQIFDHLLGYNLRQEGFCTDDPLCKLLPRKPRRDSLLPALRD